MRSIASIKELVARCAFPGFTFEVIVDGAHAYLQVVCPDGKDTATGKPMAWKGRKWQLSLHATDTEIVQTAWAAVQRALQHEACELFKFDGAAIFDRHIDVHKLVELRSKAFALDGRERPSLISASALNWLAPTAEQLAERDAAVAYWTRPENRTEAQRLGLITEDA